MEPVLLAASFCGNIVRIRANALSHACLFGSWCVCLCGCHYVSVCVGVDGTGAGLLSQSGPAVAPVQRDGSFRVPDIFSLIFSIVGGGGDSTFGKVQ